MSENKEFKYKIRVKELKDLGLEDNDAQAAVLDSLGVKGTSRYYKLEDGGVWIKTEKEKPDTLEILNSAISAVNKSVNPLKPLKNRPKVDKDVLALYVLSDFHLGMFSHKEEAGEDWDLEKGEKFLNKWIDQAIIMTPPAEAGVFLQLGDFLHTDGLEALTPAHKHPLDASARYQKIVDVAIKASKRVISRMLEKHKTVHVIMADANHDPVSSVWLRAMFNKLYKDEPRVTVDMTEHPYYAIEWGKTSIFAHHGDKRKINDISKVFASLYRDMFGRTDYSYGHIGHFHHTASSEDQLMDVQIHPTIAAKDAYAARHGWISQRRAKTILYHKDHGEIGEIVVTPSMLS